MHFSWKRFLNGKKKFLNSFNMKCASKTQEGTFGGKKKIETLFKIEN